MEMTIKKFVTRTDFTKKFMDLRKIYHATWKAEITSMRLNVA